MTSKSASPTSAVSAVLIGASGSAPVVEPTCSAGRAAPAPGAASKPPCGEGRGKDAGTFAGGAGAKTASGFGGGVTGSITAFGGGITGSIAAFGGGVTGSIAAFGGGVTGSIAGRGGGAAASCLGGAVTGSIAGRGGEVTVSIAGFGGGVTASIAAFGGGVTGSIAGRGGGVTASIATFGGEVTPAVASGLASGSGSPASAGPSARMISMLSLRGEDASRADSWMASGNAPLIALPAGASGKLDVLWFARLFSLTAG
jgi:hypothetical protein